MGSGNMKKIDKKASGALERLEMFESQLNQLLQGLQQTFGVVENRLQTVEELVTALVNVVGAQEVGEIIAKSRLEAQQAAVEAAKTALDTSVKEGKLTATAALPSAADINAAEQDEESTLLSTYLVVGREIAPDGSVLPPGRLQLPLSRLIPNIRMALAGCGPGTVIDTVDGKKFALDEVYVETLGFLSAPESQEG